MCSSDLAPQGDAVAKAQAMAREVAAQWKIEFIDEAKLAALRADRSRTTYLFDVRLPEDYAAGHRPDALSAPGGQLVQETERHATTWGARVVLVDDDGVRAVVLTGSGRGFCAGQDLADLSFEPGNTTDLGGVVDELFNPLVRSIQALQIGRAHV